MIEGTWSWGYEREVIQEEIADLEAQVAGLLPNCDLSFPLSGCPLVDMWCTLVDNREGGPK